jgi:hypothetical protein
MSDGRSAFALKENRDLDSVGAIVINNSDSLNVREAIDTAPDGVYVTDHPDEIRALDAYEAVKRVAVPEPTRSPPPRRPRAAARRTNPCLGLIETNLHSIWAEKQSAKGTPRRPAPSGSGSSAAPRSSRSPTWARRRSATAPRTVTRRTG